MEIVFSDVIRNLRNQKGIRQEVLATEFGVSVQAVSKWENNLSCPDISLLPDIAAYFGVSVDYLLTGNETKPQELEKAERELSEDDTLYVGFWYKGELLDRKQYDCDRVLELVLPEGATNIRILGKANVAGDVIGNLTVDGDLECQSVNAPQGKITVSGNLTCAESVQGNVTAGGNVECNDVDGCVTAGASVECNDVNGCVTAGASLECNDVSGAVAAGMSVSCNDVHGDVQLQVAAESGIACRAECNDVYGSVVATGNVSCGDVNGNVKAGAAVVCGNVGGNVKAGGSVACDRITGRASVCKERFDD